MRALSNTNCGKSRAAVMCESLEQRRMLAVFPYISDEEHAATLGYAWVEGTSSPDTIEISISGDELRVKVNSRIEEWDLSELNGIWVKCSGGDDYVEIDTEVTLPSIIEGDSGKDTLMGGSGKDTIYGNTGEDVLRGLDGADFLYGGDQDDTIKCGKGRDRAEGGDGKDLIDGENDSDTLYGNSNDDTLYGGSGDDWLYGGDGEDWLYGEDGSDHLDGGSGPQHNHYA